MKIQINSFLSKSKIKLILIVLVVFFKPLATMAQTDNGVSFFPNKSIDFIVFLTALVLIIVGLVIILILKLQIPVILITPFRFKVST
ncbi:hypothetical protein [Flavobacterium johnsoniae]|uniref:Uncharacterized protein n=1 Tax=Flavobacterium johnsoniae TaxID=986 RepID=A0A1M5Q7F4_FLAJO|nr:hypothetical protein [Flavobacterium johnsoniae]SHH10104.1 hypothetical protein SAMN05444388_106222 [Flavobacterium johnsoniae]